MKKNISEEALRDRMRQLAEVDKNSINKSLNYTLGTLIDYKRATNGVAYGIIKENHNYYIKKAGIKQDPDIADFTYIGGLENIKEYQYKSYADADKNRNMIFHSINEAMGTTMSKNNTKLILNEDVVSDEITKAEKKLEDAEIATSIPASNSKQLPSVSDQKNDLSSNDEENIESALDDENNEQEMDDNKNDEEELDNKENDEEEIDNKENDKESENIPPSNKTNKDIVTIEIEKMLGKLTNKIRKTEMTNSQVKSYVNTFLAAFKDKFPDVEIEDRKVMADKIIKTVPDEEIEKLKYDTPEDETEEIDEIQCPECGNFVTYAKSRGYNNANTLMNSNSDEIANLISGYGVAYADGMNDGDFKNIALIIKIINPDILDSLKNDYGHEEFVDKLYPHVQEMNENTEEDNIIKLNELFGGLSNLGKAAVGGIKTGVQKAGQAIGSTAKDIYQAGSQKMGQAKQAVGQAAQAVKQTYHAGEVPGEVKKLERIANELGIQIAALNNRLQKAGKNPIDINSILTTIKNQVSGGKNVNIANKIQETLDDPAKLNVQPPFQQLQEDEFETDDISSDENEITFAPPAQPLGGGVIKPDGAKTVTVDVNGTDKNVSVAINEIMLKFKEALNLINEIKDGSSISANKASKKTSSKKPSAGLSKEKKSQIVKAAKRGEDIGEKGKNFEKIAQSAAKKYGSKEIGEKVAAAAMWKNIKRKPISESEQKLRMYIRKRLEENAGIRKPMLNENKKSDTLKKLDTIIDRQFELFKSQSLKK